MSICTCQYTTWVFTNRKLCGGYSERFGWPSRERANVCVSCNVTNDAPVHPSPRVSIYDVPLNPPSDNTALSHSSV